MSPGHLSSSFNRTGPSARHGVLRRSVPGLALETAASPGGRGRSSGPPAGLGVLVGVVFIFPVGLLPARISLGESPSGTAALRNDSTLSPVTDGSVWQPSDLMPFPADLYPSRASAAKAVLRRELPGLLSGLAAGEGGMRQLTLRVPSEPELAASLKRAIGEILPLAGLGEVMIAMDADAVVATSSRNPITPGELRVTVTTAGPAAMSPSPGGEGTVEIAFESPTGRRTVQTRFAEAGWSEQAEHRRSHWETAGPQGPRLVAKSPELVATPQESQTRARLEAARSLADRAISLLESDPRYVGRRPALFDAAVAREELTRRALVIIDDALGTGQYFTQGFERPYGKVYRTALLVPLDRTPEEVAAMLADEHLAAGQSRARHWVRTVLSVTALGAILVGVHLFLNMATRGYYTWSVRMATLTLAAVGLACILMLA